METSAKLCLERTVSIPGHDWYGVPLTKYSIDPYVHEPQVQAAIQEIGPNGNFSLEEMMMINGDNALSVFPSVADKLGLLP